MTVLLDRSSSTSAAAIPAAIPAAIEAPPATPPSSPTGAFPGARRQISARWAVALGAGLVAGDLVMTALEPAADGPAPASPAWAVVVASVLLLSYLGALVGLACRQRWGVGAAAATASGFLVLVAACPASGHHVVAGWWLAQLTVAGALAALTLTGLRRA